jgi:Zn-dependent M28 family amino/carboxypeptidase
MKISSIFLLSTALMIALSSCNQNRQSTETKEEPVALKPAPFNADTAYAFAKKQVEFGPRVPNTPAHSKCASFLAASLRRYTKDVIVQRGTVNAYDGTALKFSNIIGSFNPEAKVRVLLLSHWDSRPMADHDPDPAKRRQPVDAANDGGSGVGVLLEIARQLSLKKPAIGVDILLVDAEDYGAPEDASSNATDDWALGSQYWAKNPHKQGYTARYGILLDMVGAKDAHFTLEATTMKYAPDIARKVWAIGEQLGYGDVFSNEETNGITDDHVYINEIIRVPTIDIIQYDPTTSSGFYKNWHTTHDDMKGISKETLQAVGTTVLTAVYNEK